MNNYIIIDGQLMHAAKKHKYIAKVKQKNGKYRYFYDRGEYEAWLSQSKTEVNAKNNKKNVNGREAFAKVDSKHEYFRTRAVISKPKGESKTEVNAKNNKKKQSKIGEIFDKVLSKLKKNAVKNLGEAVKKKSNESEDGTDKEHKYVKKVKLSNGKYKYFYTDSEYLRWRDRLVYRVMEPSFMKDVPKISADKIYTSDEDMAEINEDYSRSDDKRSMNCAYCSTAYELRCRGYDVQAKEYDEDSYLGRYSDIEKFYKNPKPITIDANGEQYDRLRPKRPYINADGTKDNQRNNYTGDTIEKAIVKHSGNNTRGELKVEWFYGGGHSLVYEVVNNKVIVRDCQKNKTYTPDQLNATACEVTITRTDNLKLNKDILKTVEAN